MEQKQPPPKEDPLLARWKSWTIQSPASWWNRRWESSPSKPPWCWKVRFYLCAL